jgi:ABC-2 type transport system permease protein
VLRLEVFSHALIGLRRQIVRWALAAGGYTLLMLAAYPALPRLLGWTELAQNPAAWLNAAGFALAYPLLLGSFAVWAGSRLLGAEERDGTLALLLAYPLPRWRLLLEKFGALLAGVLAPAALVYAVLLLGNFALGLNIAPAYLLRAALDQALLALVFGGLAFLLAALNGNPRRSQNLAGLVALGAYLLNAEWLHHISYIKYLSPFYYAAGIGPQPGYPPALGGWVLIILAVLLLLLALRGFERRDLVL